MAYEIFKTDGVLLTVVGDNTVNNATSIKLVGRGKTNYGELINENFIHILENFANDSSPINPLKGQLWFDTNSNILNFYDGSSWVNILDASNISASIISLIDSPPAGTNEGDLVWLSGEQKLFVWNDNVWLQLYPIVPGQLTRIQNSTNTSFVETNSISPANSILIGAENQNRIIINQAQTIVNNQIIVNDNYTVNNVGIYTRQSYFDLISQPASALNSTTNPIQWNLNEAQIASVWLSSNRTLSNPLFMKNGAVYMLRIIQDSVGGRILNFDSAYKFEDGVPDLTTTPFAVDIITFISNGASMFASIAKDFK